MRRFTIYTKPSCQPCRGTKLGLGRAGITPDQYDEIDVSEDVDAQAFVKSLGHLEAPVVYVDDTTHWSGYRPDLIKKLPEVLAE